jgi:ATP-dependent exoDNAse (exonuclease V) beta subunit
VLRVALETRDTLPLAEWLELTWLRLGAADAYPAEDFRHARAFFDALSERVASGEWAGAQHIGTLLEDLFAQSQSTGSNPVQLMTIHRAKGLEFDHVFIPSLDRDLNRGREPLLRWLDLPRTSGESDLVMAPVPTIGDDEGGDVSRYVKRLASKRAANEQVRLLYVAATRARRSLHVSAAPRTRADGTVGPRNGTLLARLWPAIAPPGAAAGEQPTIEDPGAAPRQEEGVETAVSVIGAPTLRRLETDWSPPDLERMAGLPHLPVSRQSLEPPEFSWVGETARHIGTVVHAELEKIAAREQSPNPDEIETQRGFYAYQLRRHGVPEPELMRAADAVVRALTRTVNSARGQWIFAPGHREARSEWMLTGIAAGRLTNVVIDRSFMDADGVRWVIDFKTSSHEGGALETFLEHEMQRYRPQLETYVALVRALGTAPVRAGLYFPLLDVFRELS